MQQEDSLLAEKCGSVLTAVGSAIDWVQDNRHQVRSEADNLTADLKRSRRLIRLLRNATQRKMCVGVFGPSQSGKSYLISTLAKGSEGKLFADFAGSHHDFLSEINPVGGKESTGLVTRFTLSRPAKLPPGHPVQLRLLGETDIVKILGNTYFSDFVHKHIPEAEEIAGKLAALAQRRSGTRVDSLDEDAMADLREYFLRNFEATGRVQVLERVFWPTAMELAPELQPADRARLFGLIWNEAEPLTRLYQRLHAALQSLGFAAEAYCSFDEALADRSRTIIDVATLDGLGHSESDRMQIVTPTGQRVSLPRNDVTALTAELTIVMADKPDNFFDHTDLLDFPGYRSRYALTDIAAELGKGENLKDFFLRGKVAYLFQRYCAERELTGMLLCIGDGPQEVQSLPQVIAEWVDATHGDTPDKRTGKAPVLFFVLTKFDMELKEKQGAKDTAESRWSTRLHSSLTGFFGLQHTWPRQWDANGAFRNLFWLRNPAYLARDVFDYDQDDRELAVRKDGNIAGYLDGLRSGFLRNAEVARHFADPAAAWDAAMALNDGGISYLKERLRPICNPELKRRQIAALLAEETARLAGRLRPHWRSDDKEQERKAKEELARRLAARLAACAGAQRFGYLLRSLQVADHELYDVFFQLDRSPPASGADSPLAPVTIGTRVDAQNILDDIFGGDAQAPALEVDTAPPRDEASARAAEVEGYWIGILRAVADSNEAHGFFGLGLEEFDFLVHELIVGATRVGLRRRMEEDIRAAGRVVDQRRDKLIWKQASRAAVSINGYIDWLGFDPRETPVDRRKVVIGTRELAVFADAAPVGDFPAIQEDPSTYDAQYYRDWIAAFVHLVVANVDVEGDEVIDRESNAKLGAILGRLA